MLVRDIRHHADIEITAIYPMQCQPVRRSLQHRNLNLLRAHGCEETLDFKRFRRRLS